MTKNVKVFRVSKKMLISAVIATALILPGCGSTSDTADFKGEASMDYASGGSYESYDMAVENIEMSNDITESSSSDTGNKNNTQSNRKLIKTVDMSVETREFEELIEQISVKTDELGGYIERMDMSNYSYNSYERYSRSASVTLRIPKEKLDSFLEDVSNISNVTRRSENVTDVTLEYVDIESRKKALLTEETRLLEILNNAQTVEDLITMESRLSEVRYQLESMESKLRTYDNKIDYSTVSIDISEVKELTETKEKTTLEQIRDGFVDSLFDVLEGIRDFFVWFIINIPHLIVWAVVIFVVIKVIKFIKKRKANKNLAKTCDEADKNVAEKK